MVFSRCVGPYNNKWSNFKSSSTGVDPTNSAHTLFRISKMGNFQICPVFQVQTIYLSIICTYSAYNMYINTVTVTLCVFRVAFVLNRLNLEYLMVFLMGADCFVPFYWKSSFHFYIPSKYRETAHVSNEFRYSIQQQLLISCPYDSLYLWQSCGIIISLLNCIY